MRREPALLVVIALAGLVAGPATSTELEVQPAAKTAPSVTVIGTRQGTSILGRQVRSKADENIGRIVDIIVDRNGQVRAAVIDFGGFLGIGNRKIAVDWDALDFAANNDKREVVTLGLTRDQLKSAPEYKDRSPAIVLGAAGALPTPPYH